jgi:hypothetical protein
MGAGPDGLDRVGKALEPVADKHQYVLQAAVLQPGEHLQPILRAFAAVARPNAEDLGDCYPLVSLGFIQFAAAWCRRCGGRAADRAGL